MNGHDAVDIFRNIGFFLSDAGFDEYFHTCFENFFAKKFKKINIYTINLSIATVRDKVCRTTWKGLKNR